MDQQRHAQEAALALVRPATDATTRAAASRFLEQWTLTEQAWPTYCQWLESFAAGNEASQEAVSVQLLCLQLLLSKIRREISYDSAAVQNSFSLVHLQSTLSTYLQARTLPDAAQQPACICVAALAIRSGNLHDLLASICTSESPITTTKLRLLSEIPLEMEAVSEFSSSRVTVELTPYHSSVLNYLRNAIHLAARESKALLYAVQAAKTWVEVGRITLSQLNSTANGSPDSLLGMLVNLLSSQHVAFTDEEAIYVQTARALQEAIMVPADSCTDSRNAACRAMLNAVAYSGFLAAALQHATNHDWDDAASAIALLASTFVTEEIDEMVTQPAETMLLLLLQLQTHPVGSVRIAVLDCWLTVSDIPVRQRHEHWQAPLFRQVTAALLQAAQYTDDTDEDDLAEFRRMVVDVLVASYFLLRSEYVQHMATAIVSGNHAQAEAALFALSAASREINARIVSRTTGASSSSLLAKDKKRTAEALLQVVQYICRISSANEMFQVGVAKFFGAFAASWSVHCSSDDVLQLLSFLQNVIVHSGKDQSASPKPVSDSAVVVESGRAIKSILVGCSSIILSPPAAPMPESLRRLMETVLFCNCDEAMAEVAEGYTRLIAETKDVIAVGQVQGELVRFLVEQVEAALRVLPQKTNTTQGLTEEATLAIESVGRYLNVLRVVIRFSDAVPASTSAENPIASIICTVFPFLESVSQRTSPFEQIFSKILAVQQQLLRNMPDLVAPYFPHTMKHVIAVFEANLHPSCLGYVSCAVETYGSSCSDTFLDLLSHVAAIVLGVIQQDGADSNSDLALYFFEMNQRYFLYCPFALVGCPHFPAIVFCAVECAVSCEDREAKRVSLNFLTHVFGWRTLRLSAETNTCLRNAAELLDMQLIQHGARTTQTCIDTLLGVSQALWPACTECIFAIMSASVAGPVSKDSETSIACQWIESACGNVEHAKADVVKKVVSLLLEFARQGPKNKPKAKQLLSDFCMIHKGDLPVDTLVSYNL